MQMFIDSQNVFLIFLLCIIFGTFGSNLMKIKPEKKKSLQPFEFKQNRKNLKM